MPYPPKSQAVDAGNGGAYDGINIGKAIAGVPCGKKPIGTPFDKENICDGKALWIWNL